MQPQHPNFHASPQQRRSVTSQSTEDRSDTETSKLQLSGRRTEEEADSEEGPITRQKYQRISNSTSQTTQEPRLNAKETAPNTSVNREEMTDNDKTSVVNGIRESMLHPQTMGCNELQTMLRPIPNNMEQTTGLSGRSGYPQNVDGCTIGAPKFQEPTTTIVPSPLTSAASPRSSLSALSTPPSIQQRVFTPSNVGSSLTKETPAHLYYTRLPLAQGVWRHPIPAQSGSTVSSCAVALLRSLEQAQVSGAALQVCITSHPRWSRLQKDTSLVTLLTDLIRSLADFSNLFLQRLMESDSTLINKHNSYSSSTRPQPEIPTPPVGHYGAEGNADKALDPATLRAAEAILEFLKEADSALPAITHPSSTSSLLPQALSMADNTGGERGCHLKTENGHLRQIKSEFRTRRPREELDHVLEQCKRQCLPEASTSFINNVAPSFIEKASNGQNAEKSERSTSREETALPRRQPVETSPNADDGGKVVYDFLSTLVRQLSSSIGQDSSFGFPNAPHMSQLGTQHQKIIPCLIAPTSSVNSTLQEPPQHEIALTGSILDELLEALSRENGLHALPQSMPSEIFTALDSNRSQGHGEANSDGLYQGARRSSKIDCIKGVYWSPASNAWFAQWYDSASKKQVHRSFQANRHGFERAKELAIEARLEAIKSGAASVGKKAKSGVCGISWHAAHNSWRATFKHNSPFIPGASKLYQRSFSINAYGAEEALKMAVEWRENQEKAAHDAAKAASVAIAFGGLSRAPTPALESIALGQLPSVLKYEETPHLP